MVFSWCLKYSYGGTKWACLVKEFHSLGATRKGSLANMLATKTTSRKRICGDMKSGKLSYTVPSQTIIPSGSGYPELQAVLPADALD